MNIEEIAFKDRTELAHLNEIDLLNIVELLQKDRKQWINQFSKTHNESVEIQKENQELKKQLENKYEKVGTLTNEILYEENTKLINQQKEFIKYLQEELNVQIQEESVGCEITNKRYILEEILQKYKEITEKIDNENND